MPAQVLEHTEAGQLFLPSRVRMRYEYSTIRILPWEYRIRKLQTWAFPMLESCQDFEILLECSAAFTFTYMIPEYSTDRCTDRLFSRIPMHHYACIILSELVMFGIRCLKPGLRAIAGTGIPVLGIILARRNNSQMEVVEFLFTDYHSGNGGTIQYPFALQPIYGR